MKSFFFSLFLQDVLVLPKVTYPGKGIFSYTEIKDFHSNTSFCSFRKCFVLQEFTTNNIKKQPLPLMAFGRKQYYIIAQRSIRPVG
jgi:hypothetical protein